MDNNLDFLICVASHSNNNLITSILCTCRIINKNEKEIFKRAFELRYHSANYFDFWTPRQNYLVKYKRDFALLVNFHDKITCSPFIYEYGGMMKNLFHLIKPSI